MFLRTAGRRESARLFGSLGTPTATTGCFPPLHPAPDAQPLHPPPDAARAAGAIGATVTA